MTARKTFAGTEYTIALDASFDLYQAGHANDDAACNDFAAAYRGAASDLAEECGIEITVISGTYDGPAMQRQTANGDEGERGGRELAACSGVQC